MCHCMAIFKIVRPQHGCQMAIARFLDRMCLALRASGLWLRYAALQNLIPSFPWIAPPRPPPWHNPRKGRDQILPSGNLARRRGTRRRGSCSTGTPWPPGGRSSSGSRAAGSRGSWCRRGWTPRRTHRWVYRASERSDILSDFLVRRASHPNLGFHILHSKVASG